MLNNAQRYMSLITNCNMETRGPITDELLIHGTIMF